VTRPAARLYDWNRDVYDSQVPELRQGARSSHLGGTVPAYSAPPGFRQGPTDAVTLLIKEQSCRVGHGFRNLVTDGCACGGTGGIKPGQKTSRHHYEVDCTTLKAAFEAAFLGALCPEKAYAHCFGIPGPSNVQ